MNAGLPLAGGTPAKYRRTVDSSLIATIITSAGVGAFVTAGFTFMGGWFERRARRRELLLSRALDSARTRTEFNLKMADKTGETIELQDDIILAEDYFQWLSHLMDHGKLPPDAKAKEEQSRREYGMPEVEVSSLPPRQRRR